MRYISIVFQPIEIERKTVYEKVVQVLKSSIMSGELKPGDKLPSERKLAEMLNVSRTSVREAIKILAAEGLVQIRHGQGIFVNGLEDPDRLIREFTKVTAIDDTTIKDFLEIRRILEVNAAKWAAERGTDEQLNQLLQLVEETKRQLQDRKKGVLLLLADHDTKFHNLLAEATGNTVLVQIMRNLLDLLSEVRLRCLQIDGRPLKSLKEHENVARALIARDCELAEKAMDLHIRSVEKDIIERELYRGECQNNKNK